MQRLTDRRTAEALKSNAEKLREKGFDIPISDQRYIKLAEYENAEERRNDNMKITKEELIEEISKQLDGIGLIAEAMDRFDLSQSIALFDLQFRLKCKLYELTNEQEG